MGLRIYLRGWFGEQADLFFEQGPNPGLPGPAGGPKGPTTRGRIYVRTYPLIRRKVCPEPCTNKNQQATHKTSAITPEGARSRNATILSESRPQQPELVCLVGCRPYSAGALRDPRPGLPPKREPVGQERLSRCPPGWAGGVRACRPELNRELLGPVRAARPPRRGRRPSVARGGARRSSLDLRDRGEQRPSWEENNISTQTRFTPVAFRRQCPNSARTPWPADREFKSRVLPIRGRLS